jgi:DivIVA domain-containing protein
MPYGPPGAQRPAQRVSAADVRTVRFGKPPFGKRGYDEAEVDDFLRLVADTLARTPGGSRVSAGQVHEIAFRKPKIGSRGYDEDEVDAFLDVVEGELKWRETPEGQHEAAADGLDPALGSMGGPMGGGSGPPGGPIGPAMGGPPGMGMGGPPGMSGPPGLPPMGGSGMGMGSSGMGGQVAAPPVPPPPPYAPARQAVRATAVVVIYDRGRLLAVELTDPQTGRTAYRPPGGDVAFGERGNETVQRAFHDEYGTGLTDVRPLATLESIYRFGGGEEHELVLVYEAVPLDQAVWQQQRLIGRGPNGPTSAVWAPIDLFRRREASLLPDGMLALLDTLPG